MRRPKRKSPDYTVPNVRHDVSLLSDKDRNLFQAGRHGSLYEKMGAHPIQIDGVEGTHFAVWAPNARQVSVIGEFNGWTGNVHMLSSGGGEGVWEGFIPGLGVGELYKFRIAPKNNFRPVDKADPFGHCHENPPSTASIVWDLDYTWDDQDWLEQRAGRNDWQSPISVYEVHLGSWVHDGGNPLTYRELAPLLSAYMNELGFTHVEFMPVMEHPFYGSWGYQITGFFAPTSRYGTPQDFMHLVDHLHQNGIGVILDWVPFHFPGDDHGLVMFDGTSLYEHPDPRRGYFPGWNTFVFNYERKEVWSFLLSSALLWVDRYHADGLRLDAVSSMLYLDYLRKPGEWLPNKDGGNQNIEALEFLKQFNSLMHATRPGVMTIAEDSTGTPNVAVPVERGGLGFDMKWDLGWINDIQGYMLRDPKLRGQHHNDLTLRPTYAFEQNFLLPLSHDEVKPGMGSLRSKLPGDDWEKLAGLRLLLGYMYVQPGKKLLFMGSEFGQKEEWRHDGPLDWSLLEEPGHSAIQRFIGDLNRIYRSEPPLYTHDFDEAGFEWVFPDDAENNVVSFLRRGKTEHQLLLAVCNFSASVHHNYRVGVPQAGFWSELLNSDAKIYGGRGHGNQGGVRATPIPFHGYSRSINLTLPALSIELLKPGDGLP